MGRRKVSTSEITTSDVPVPPLNLPEELVIEIHSWLPVESLLRFRSVCKISSPNFAKTQLNRAAINRNHPSSLVVLQKGKTRDEKSIFRILRCLDSVNNQVITLKTPTTTRAELLLLDIVGCCDGIVCLKSLGVTFLWNPATKQAKGVPFSSPSKSYCNFSIGFGFDPLFSHYKVVKISYGFSHVRSVQVYSLNAAGSWIEIQVEELRIGEFNSLNGCAGACVKGVMYWKILRGFELLSFDLHNEVVVLYPEAGSIYRLSGGL